MAEDIKGLKRLWAGKKANWLMIVAAVLALALIVEGVCVAGILLKSRRQASSMASVERMHADSTLHGVTLYASGKNFVIDNTFLMKLSELQSQGIQLVRIPIDLTGRITGSGADMKLDGEWLRQTASIMEMIFQSNYQVILSVRMPADSTPDSYAAAWTQIDEAFGHRPASEMWYDLTMPTNGGIAAWGVRLQSIVSAVRLTNADREILLAIPEDMEASACDTLVLLLSGSNVHFGFPAQINMDSDTLLKYMRYATLSENTALLIEPEGGMATAQLANVIKANAENYGFGYLLQGD